MANIVEVLMKEIINVAKARIETNSYYLMG